MAYRHPQAFATIIDVLVDNSIQYLLGQLKAGADVLQIFDTWAGVLPPREFLRWSVEPTKRIVEGVRKQVPGAKIIGFPRGAGSCAFSSSGTPAPAGHEAGVRTCYRWRAAESTSAAPSGPPGAGRGRGTSPAEAPSQRRRERPRGLERLRRAFARPNACTASHESCPHMPARQTGPSTQEEPPAGGQMLGVNALIPPRQAPWHPRPTPETPPGTEHSPTLPSASRLAAARGAGVPRSGPG